MGRDYKKIPIVDTAHRCGLVLNTRTLTRGEVEASCPFCGDHGVGKYHLFLNTSTDQYRCVLCGAQGNSVTLYARVMRLSNREAFQELEEGGNVYPMPKKPDSQYTEAAPRKLSERSEVYSTMLDLLTLSDRHRENLYSVSDCLSSAAERHGTNLAHGCSGDFNTVWSGNGHGAGYQ